MRQSPEARVRILDAAESLFAERGFDATATSTIAAAAAVPKGLLFYYFPTKADLLCTLVGERLDLGPIDMDALIAPGDPARALLNLARRLSEIRGSSDVLRVIIWREQRTHPAVKAKLREHRRQVQSMVERVLQGSIHRPIAARRLRTAAVAWVAILAIRPQSDRGGTTTPEDPATELPALAELISAGLSSAPQEL